MAPARLLDAGCGPGVLTVELADRFEEAIGLDPDADILAEGERRAKEAGLTNVRWVRALAEDIPRLELGRFRLVTFGQSFHWTEREPVAEAVYDILEPGGALALVVHDGVGEGRPAPDGPGHPPIPHEEIQALLRAYLGQRRRAGQGYSPELPPGRWWEKALARTRFGRPRGVLAPGRPDIVRGVDGVLSNYHSTSFAAPHLFGDRLEAFQRDMHALLSSRSASGLF